MTEFKTEGICPHCKMDIAIRNPSGYCDHLYYPEYCKVCSGTKEDEKQSNSMIKSEKRDEKYLKEGKLFTANEGHTLNTSLENMKNGLSQDDELVKLQNKVQANSEWVQSED